MVAYIDYKPPLGMTVDGVCVNCREELNLAPVDNSEDRLVMHLNGGDKHPLHLRCAKLLHDSGFDNCLICRTLKCDPVSLYPENQRLFRRITRFYESTTVRLITRLTICVFAFISVWNIFNRSNQTSGSSIFSFMKGIVIGYNGAVELNLEPSDNALVYLASITALNGLFYMNPETALVSVLGGAVVLKLSQSSQKIKELSGLVILMTLPYFADFIGAPNSIDFEFSIMLSVGLAAGLGTIMRLYRALNIPERVVTEPLFYPDA